MTEQASTPLAVSDDLSKTIQSAVDTNDIKAAVQAEILKQEAVVKGKAEQLKLKNLKSLT